MQGNQTDTQPPTSDQQIPQAAPTPKQKMKKWPIIAVVAVVLFGCGFIGNLLNSGTDSNNSSVKDPESNIVINDDKEEIPGYSTEEDDPSASTDQVTDIDLVPDPPLVAVPELVGFYASDVDAQLEELGLSGSYTSNDGKLVFDRSAWTVIYQDPAAGSEIFQTSKVNLVVAKIKVNDGWILTDPDIIGAQYVKGTYVNVSNQEFTSVTIEFGLYDEDGVKVGTATDYSRNTGVGVTVAIQALAFSSSDKPAVRAELESISYY